MKSLALILVGIVGGLVISTHFTKKQVSCLFQSWYEASPYCSDKYPERGDKMEIVNMPDSKRDYYEDCEVTYLAGQAEAQDNVAFVLLSGCYFQKEGFKGDPVTDIISTKNLRKIQ